MVFDHIFTSIQRAVEVAQTSAHPNRKVGAYLVGQNNSFAIARSNFWPATIQETIGIESRIGNASATVHAETACLLFAPSATGGAAIFSTDPSCPNCAKNM